MSNMTRSCGSCGACCKIFNIVEPILVKPAGKWCAHWKRDAGCGIYESRPGTCRTFSCMWLQGHGTEAERPDKTKVVVDLTPPLSTDMPNGVMRMSEVSVGALASSYATRLLAHFLAEGVFVSHALLNGKRKLHVPKSRLLTPQTRQTLQYLNIDIIA